MKRNQAGRVSKKGAFEEFRGFARRLIGVPKEEIDKKMDDYRNEKEIKAKPKE